MLLYLLLDNLKNDESVVGFTNMILFSECIVNITLIMQEVFVSHHGSYKIWGYKFMWMFWHMLCSDAHITEESGSFMA